MSCAHVSISLVQVRCVIPVLSRSWGLAITADCHLKVAVLHPVHDLGARWPVWRNSGVDMAAGMEKAVSQMFDIHKQKVMWGGRKLTLETGRIARQADGAVLATYGETVVLCAVTAARNVKEGQDFFPLDRKSVG